MGVSTEELPADSNAEMTLTTRKEVSTPVVLARVVEALRFISFFFSPDVIYRDQEEVVY
jgi:hypothetical protein